MTHNTPLPFKGNNTMLKSEVVKYKIVRGFRDSPVAEEFSLNIHSIFKWYGSKRQKEKSKRKYEKFAGKQLVRSVYGLL